MESKFRPVAYYIPLFVLVFSAAFIATATGWMYTSTLLFTFCFAFFFLYMVVWFLFGELRTKAIKLKLEGSYLIKSGYLGIGPTTKYHINDLDGFKTATVSSRVKEYEYFYLIANSKKIVKLSSFYHANYSEFKNKLLTKRLQFLGNEDQGFISDIMDLFM